MKDRERIRSHVKKGSSLVLKKRLHIVDRLYDKFNGAIPKLILFDALYVISNDLATKITEEESVHIHNFGIFYKTEHQRGTVGADICTGELRREKTKSYISINFIASQVFSQLINCKKHFFKKA